MRAVQFGLFTMILSVCIFSGNSAEAQTYTWTNSTPANGSTGNGLTQNLSATVTSSTKNLNNGTITYTISNIPSGTTVTYTSGGVSFGNVPSKPMTIKGTLTTAPRLPAGTTIAVTFTAKDILGNPLTTSTTTYTQ